MIFIYNFFLFLLSPFLIFWWGIKLASPKYSTGWAQRLGFLPSELTHRLKNCSVLWVHAVSVGEVIAALPLIDLLKKRYPERKLILSTVTVTGHQTARYKIKELDGLFYFPYDIPWVIHRVVRLIHPAIFIFFETEIWPNLLNSLHRKKIPAVLVNGRLSNKSFSRYYKLRWFMKSSIKQITLCLMQTEEDKKKILCLGGNEKKVLKTGNTKYDQLRKPDKIPFQEFKLLTQWEWLVAGSTHSGEEEIILKAFLALREQFPRLGLILAPRHPERFEEISLLLDRNETPFLKRSHLKKDSFWDRTQSPVILLDTMGDLADFYYWATIAFIGGSLVPKGGHNVLEAVIWQKAPFFGRYCDNFKEMVGQFKGKEAGIELLDQDDMIEKISFYLKNRHQLEQMGRKALGILIENQGATRRNLEEIGKLIQ